MNHLLSNHAIERCQVRGCKKQAANLVLALHDRTNYVADGVISIWVSHERAARLADAGLPPSVIERVRRFLFLLDAETGRVVTVVNAAHKDASKYRRNFRRRRGSKQWR